MGDISDILGIDPNQMKTTATAIQKDTDQLGKDTQKLMGQLDDVYLNFPPGAANLAQTSQISLQAIFDRVQTEDTRISLLLQAIAQAVEQLEQQLAKEFSLPSN